MSKQSKKTSLLEAFAYAFKGIGSALIHERNIKIEAGFALFAIVVSALLQLEPLEWAAVIVCCVVVLGFELANSALESLVDLTCKEVNPLAKHAKDTMAGAVLIVAIGAAIVGLIIFINAALRIWS